MGIRVDPETLVRQLRIRGLEHRLEFPFHRMLAAGDLPQSIGGGIGQSRMCMFFLRTAHIGEVSVVARVSTVKPKLARHPLEGKKPPKAASKGTRRVFQKGRWHVAQIFEMSELRAGNEIGGLAVIEAPNTTLFVPHEWQMRIDEHQIYWLTRRGASKQAAARPTPARHAKRGGKR